MSGKPKDESKQYAPGWGGPGRGQGRKSKPYKLRQLTVAVLDDAEFEALRLAVPNTRRRTEILMREAENGNNPNKF